MYGYDKATTSSSLEKEALKHLLRDYFQLDTVSLASCYQQWSEADPHFHKIMAIKGIRMLRQDPWECLVGFICSSANNITRITRMVKALRIHYGPKIATIDGRDYHGFPSISALAQPNVEKELRTLGFGYRAKYIVNTATKMMTDHPEAPEAWLKGLRKVPYSEAKLALLSMPGVGPKVADCVCLSSLDHAKAIPVDTHVWQIALRDYGFKTKHPRTKTLTAKLYDQIGDHFRGLFGDYSGWAQSVSEVFHLCLFCRIFFYRLILHL
ncbi:OGG1 protein type 2e [Spinellus fusiger]|nr:OGG1 protein type 2e [Spinellus fusiger]